MLEGPNDDLKKAENKCRVSEKIKQFEKVEEDIKMVEKDKI